MLNGFTPNCRFNGICDSNVTGRNICVFRLHSSPFHINGFLAPRNSVNVQIFFRERDFIRHRTATDTDSVVKYATVPRGSPIKPTVHALQYIHNRYTKYPPGFFIVCYDQQTQKYFTNYHTPTCFDIIVSSSGSLKSIPYQVTQVFQKQLLVIRFTINTLRTGDADLRF